MTIVLGSNLIVAGGGGDDHTKYTDAEAITAVEGEATLDLTGDVDVATGKTLSADGLLFPDTQVASADPNTLDDYEEGTWTPVLWDQSLSDGEGQAYVTQVGRYTKIGNRVFFTAFIHTSSIGTLSAGDAVSIGGLPFTSNSTAANLSAGAVGSGGGLAITADQSPSLRVAANVAHVAIFLWDSNAGHTSFLVSEWTADGNMSISGNYEV